jgi:hypothetical protein
MSSHVAQLFLDDADWTETLRDLRRALAPGGRLVFDSRDPTARGWQRWNPTESWHEVTLPDRRGVTVWTELTAMAGEVVEATLHYVFPGGEELLSTIALRFRGEDELRRSLADAGFYVDAIYGGWRREPVGHPDGELLVLAHTL